MTKTCSKCRETKPVEDFSPSTDQGRQRYCLPCMADVNKTYYQKRRAKLQAIKEASPCDDCGQFFPAVCMDFDHRPGTVKEISIGRMVLLAWSRIESEMEKCDLVCANCHRIRTRDRGDHKGSLTAPGAGMAWDGAPH